MPGNDPTFEEPPEPYARSPIPPSTLQRDLDQALGRPQSFIHGQPAYLLSLGEYTHRAEILKTIDQLPDAPPDGKLLHIGIAGFHNLDMLATGKFNYGILLDINDNQARMWQEV